MEELQFEQNKENKQQRQEASAFDTQEDEARLQNMCMEEVEETTFGTAEGKKKMFI